MSAATTTNETNLPAARHLGIPSAGAMSLGTLFQLIGEDWVANGRDWTRPGFRALVVHRFGNWRMGLKTRLLRLPFSFVYWQLFRFVRNMYGIELPYSVQVGRRVVIEHQGCIVIHGSSVIGDECIIRQGVTLGNRHIDRPMEAPQLGVGVSLGAGAKVLGAVRLGDGAQVGANAVVCGDVPANTTVVGIPARPIHPRGARLSIPEQSLIEVVSDERVSV